MTFTRWRSLAAVRAYLQWSLLSRLCSVSSPAPRWTPMRLLPEAVRCRYGKETLKVKEISHMRMAVLYATSQCSIWFALLVCDLVTDIPRARFLRHWRAAVSHLTKVGGRVDGWRVRNGDIWAISPCALLENVNVLSQSEVLARGEIFRCKGHSISQCGDRY